ncbi:tetratricopeptide repeat domain 21A, partial [Cichlidogyrus casuarinus]
VSLELLKGLHKAIVATEGEECDALLTESKHVCTEISEVVMATINMDCENAFYGHLTEETMTQLSVWDRLRIMRGRAIFIESQINSACAGIFDYENDLRDLLEKTLNELQNLPGQVQVDAKTFVDRRMAMFKSHIGDPNSLVAAKLMREERFQECLECCRLALETSVDATTAELAFEAATRLGDMENAQAVLDQLKQASSKHCNLKAIWIFYQGILWSMRGDACPAIDLLYSLRTDAQLRERALIRVVEIYFKADWSLSISKSLNEQQLFDEAEASAIAKKSIQTANELLADICDVNSNILQGLRFLGLMLMRTKSQFEGAITGLNNLLDTIKDPAETLFIKSCLAQAYCIAKQPSKAQILLEELVTTPWSLECAASLERAYLLSGEMYLQADKYAKAEQILRTCLIHNEVGPN